LAGLAAFDANTGGIVGEGEGGQGGGHGHSNQKTPL
jgi:hypothetical protein